MADYALSSDALLAFGRALSQGVDKFIPWAKLTDRIGPSSIPFYIKPECFEEIPFAELGLSPFKTSELVPQPGEMWVLFCYRETFSLAVGKGTPLRTDGFPLILEWRKDVPDSSLLSPSFHRLADLVRKQIGATSYGLHPAYARYRDNVSFTDSALFGDADDETSSIASAYGALLSGLTAAVTGKRYSFWPFPTMQWDEARGKLCGVGGLKEKLSVAADCSASVVTVAGEQKREAEELLAKFRATTGSNRFKRIRVFAAKSTADARKLGRNIYEMSIKRTRLVRAAAFSVFCLMTILFAGGLYWWDWNREKIVYYKDYVDKFGEPQGLYEIDKAQIKGRGQTYRMHYKGYDKFLWGRKPILRKMFCVNSFDCIIEEKRDLPLHPKTAGQIFFYDENNKLKEVHYVKPNMIAMIKLIYLGANANEICIKARGKKGQWANGIDENETNFYLRIWGMGNHPDLRMKISRCKIIRDINGFIKEISYLFNDNGVCAYDRNGVSVRRYEVDSLGRIKKVRELKGLKNLSLLAYSYEYNEVGELKSKLSGNFIERYEYTPLGNLKTIIKFLLQKDKKESNIKELLFSSSHYEYDDYGNWVVKINKDRKGITPDEKGIAIIERRIKYVNGRIYEVEEKYKDKYNKKCANKDVVRTVTRYNADKTPEEIYNYDKDNLILPSSKKYIIDKYGRIRTEFCIDSNGRVFVSPKTGWAKKVVDYHNLSNGGLKEIVTYYDVKDCKVIPCSRLKASQEVWLYDSFGLVKNIKLYGLEDDNPIIGATGFHSVEFSHNQFGHCEEVAYYGINEAKVLAFGFHIDTDKVFKKRIETDALGQPLKTMYYGLEGLMNTRFGYAIVRKMFNHDGTIRECLYFDRDKKPIDPIGGSNHRTEYEYDLHGVKTKAVFTSVNGEKIIEEYNNKGLVKRRSYLKSNGELIADDKGVAIIEYWYDEKGREIKRLFSGVDGSISLTSELIAGWQSFYDGKGNICRKSFVGINGELKTDINGVAIIDFVYDDYKNVIEQTFYNTHTNLVCSRDGNVAGFRWEYDSFGNKIEEYKIDARGRILKDKNNVSIISSVYNGKRQRTEQRFYDEYRIRINSNEGIGGWLSEYDERGNEAKRRYIDKDDKLCSINGCYGWVQKYDNRNRVVEYADLVDEGRATIFKVEIDGALIVCDKATITYDHLGRQEVWARSKTPKGFWGADLVAVRYSQSKNVERYRLLNSETNLVYSSLGFSYKESKYNEYDELIEESWWDKNGNPAMFRGIHRSEVHYYRNNMGLKIEMFNYGTNGFPVVGQNTGLSKTSMMFDKEMRLTMFEGLDDNGNPIGFNGTTVSSASCKYDENGRVVSIKYKTIDGKGCIGENIAGFEIEYPLNDNNEVLLTLLDVKWKKLETKRVKKQDVQSLQLLGVSKVRYSKNLIIQSFK